MRYRFAPISVCRNFTVSCQADTRQFAFACIRFAVAFLRGKFYSSKKTAMARVSTYLNFQRTTEEAFRFYQSVFGGEFIGHIARFGDMPPMEGMQPLPDEDKNLVMHIALPILGGHVLMGTDAPQSMGFSINAGNQVHINLEPDTRDDTKRLFEALSAGGTVTMDLQDMFWGAYYGSFTDRFGIQWMVNCDTGSQS
jgi:PhnB protein